MSNWKIALACSVFFLCATGTAFAMAQADIIDATGKSIGTARLIEQKDGVSVAVTVSGLPPGRHGFHIHETGTCAPPDFKSAGGHFNPFHKHHGSASPEGKHAGDLPNLEVREDGSAAMMALATGATLSKGPGSLLKEGGTALVIHAQPDDNMSDPAGNAGPRIACGVIKAK